MIRVPHLETLEKYSILSRIKGENSLHHVRFHVDNGKASVVKTRKLLSVSYPEVLGPPVISPGARFVAFVHKSKSELWVKVYSLASGTFKARTIGGGDTARAPAWGPGSKKLYFLTNNLRGIIEWSLPKEKKIKFEIYDTSSGVERFNELSLAGVKVSASLHLTC